MVFKSFIVLFLRQSRSRSKRLLQIPPIFLVYFSTGIAGNCNVEEVIIIIITKIRIQYGRIFIPADRIIFCPAFFFYFNLLKYLLVEFCFSIRLVDEAENFLLFCLWDFDEGDIESLVTLIVLLVLGRNKNA